MKKIALLFLLLSTPAWADTPISGLPTAGSLTGAELTPIVQGGTTVHTTTQAIANLGGSGSGTVSNVSCSLSLAGLTCTVANPTTTPAISISGILGPANGGTGLATIIGGDIYKGNGTAAMTPSALSDSGTLVSSSESLDATTNAFVVELANGSPGTTLNKLVKISSSGAATIAATTDTSGIIGVVSGGAGTSGNAQIAVSGQASCVFDNAVAAGDYVGISSTTAGDCHDVGSALPTSGENVGRVLVSNASPGTYVMTVNPGSTYINNSSSGASGAVQTSNGSGGFSNFALPITVPQGGLNMTSACPNGDYLQSNGSAYVCATGTGSGGSGSPGGSTTQLQYNAGSGNFGGLTTFYVQAYGAVCNGSTVDTTAIQNAINAASSAGGGQVMFPPGTCVSATLTLPSFVQLRGSSFGGSIIKLANSTNADLIIGANFNSLTGTNSTGGITGWSLIDLTLNGNKANNTATAGAACGATSGTSNGIKVYGYNFYTERVQVFSFAGCGWYSEWSTASDIGGGATGEMEAHINNMKFGANGSVGLYWNGPHDSKASYIYTFWNGGTGMVIYTAGGQLEVFHYHGYQEPTDIDLEGPYVQCFDCDAEGSINIGNNTAGGGGSNVVMLNSGTTTLTLGTAGQPCNAGPYKLTFINFGVTNLVNNSDCGFFDTWINGGVGAISGALGAYTPDLAFGQVNGVLQTRMGNSQSGTYPFSFWNGTGDTKLFSPSSGAFAINNNAAQAILISSTNQVAIGTASPISGTTFGVNGDVDLKASSYFNWGTTDGVGGYGLRDNSGTIQFKNNSGAWTNLGSVLYPASGDLFVSTGTTSAPSGIAPVNGLCIVGSGGAWGAGSCAGTSSINLGTSASATSPQISGDPTTGFYTAGAGLVDIASSGTKMVEWNNTGETQQHNMTVLGKITYGATVNVHLHAVTSGATYNISASTDYFVCVNKTSGSATSVVLPASPTVGDLYIVKDCKGDAGSNNITVTASGATIDGSSSVVINTNYGLSGFIASSSSTWAIE